VEGSKLRSSHCCAGSRPVPEPAVPRSQTELVALNVTVIDEKGNVVRGLTQDAFTVTEDGKPQPIVQFTGDPVPLSLAIALDASFNMKGRRFEYARDAVWRLLDHLAPDDEVCVYGFTDRPFVVAPWTSDVQAVARALVSVIPDGNTAMYTTVSSALVVISDGNEQLPATCLRKPTSSRRPSGG
jgi:VWFA-related protein